MKVFPADDKIFGEIQNTEFAPAGGEGVFYIKLVAFKPETLKSGNPAKAVADAPGVVTMGNLDEIKAQFNQWFDEMSAAYKKDN